MRFAKALHIQNLLLSQDGGSPGRDQLPLSQDVCVTRLPNFRHIELPMEDAHSL